MGLTSRLTSWFMIAVLTVVWAVPVGALSARAQTGEETGRRIALVVGNSDYSSADKLKNAVNDSRAVADTLEGLGFEVFEYENIARADFAPTVEAFAREAENAEAAVFYYSGHGFQLGGTNHLVPVDASLTSRESIEAETLRLDTIIETLQHRDRQTLIFLDACRNNPLPESLRDKSGDGLAQIETGTGTFVAFATQPGNIARDGAGDNSPFTSALVEHISAPGLSISDMMIKVRNSVEDLTAQTQTPWDQSSLRSQFYFNPQVEADATLTDEDKELLLSLDPELRKKFEERFGITIRETAEGEEEEEQVATIQPRFLITSADDEAEEEEPVVGGLLIQRADEADTTSVLAALPEVGNIPLPQARPGGEALAADTQENTDQKFEGPFVPAQVANSAAPASRSGDKEIVVAAASPSEALTGEVGGAALGPTVRSIDRIAGQEVGAQETGLVAVPARKEPAPASELAALEPRPSSGAFETPTVADTPKAAASKADSVVARPVSAPSSKPAPAMQVEGAPVLIPAEAAPVVAGAPTLTPAPASKEEQIQLAALDPDEIRPPAIERAEPEPEEDEVVEEPEIDEREMARLIQTELQRLGCYRSGIDGLWGNMSARALLRFYATKKEAPDQLEPNAPLLTRLKAEPEVVCKVTAAPAPKKPAAPKAAPSQSKPVATRTQRPSQPAAQSPSRPKAAARSGDGPAPSRKLSKKLNLGGLR
ncbi:MAG: caspase family protein [Rhizobiaceae bacterium]|nr:caspase family protein [Rhizobiaceae bacterium]MCV0405802.1 caspase family protein [Rhizobiaceae bacterium]